MANGGHMKFGLKIICDHVAHKNLDIFLCQVPLTKRIDKLNNIMMQTRSHAKNWNELLDDALGDSMIV